MTGSAGIAHAVAAADTDAFPDVTSFGTAVSTPTFAARGLGAAKDRDMTGDTIGAGASETAPSTESTGRGTGRAGGGGTPIGKRHLLGGGGGGGGGGTWRTSRRP